MVRREGEVERAGASAEGDFAVDAEAEGSFFDGMIAYLGASRDADKRVSLQGFGESWWRGA